MPSVDDDLKNDLPESAVTSTTAYLARHKSLFTPQAAPIEQLIPVIALPQSQNSAVSARPLDSGLVETGDVDGPDARSASSDGRLRTSTAAGQRLEESRGAPATVAQVTTSPAQIAQSTSRGGTRELLRLASPTFEAAATTTSSRPSESREKDRVASDRKLDDDEAARAATTMSAAVGIATDASEKSLNVASLVSPGEVSVVDSVVRYATADEESVDGVTAGEARAGGHRVSVDDEGHFEDRHRSGSRSSSSSSSSASDGSLVLMDIQGNVSTTEDAFRFVRKTLQRSAFSHEELRAEFRCLDYSPESSVRPIDMSQPLRVVKAGRTIRLMIGITCYNEEGDELKRTLAGIASNLTRLCRGGLHWSEIAVMIILDGRAKMHASMVQYLQHELRVFDPELLLEEHAGRPVTMHIFERTVTIPRAKSTRDYYPPLQISVGVKERNGGKLHSHLWLFSGMSTQVNPKYVMLLDVGTVPRHNAISRMYSSMEEDPTIGGACGEISVRGVKVWHPLDAAQAFEYSASHVLDKAADSTIGYIPVLPGAFSMYRWCAIRGEPLCAYFTIEETPVRDLGPFMANMFLAEDRILGFQVAARRHCDWQLAYVKGSVAETDAPGTLIELIKQRRRWLNGAFFSTAYYLANFGLFWNTAHSVTKKLFLLTQFCFAITTAILSWFALASLYLTFMLVVQQAALSAPFGQQEIITLFSTMFLLLIVVQVLVAVGGKVSEWTGLYLGITMVYAALMAGTWTLGVWLLATGSINWITGIAAALSMGGYVIAGAAHGSLFRLLSVTGQYVVLIPFFNITLPIYSFSNLHDISWGTKEGSLREEARRMHNDIASKRERRAEKARNLLKSLVAEEDAEKHVIARRHTVTDAGAEARARWASIAATPSARAHERQVTIADVRQAQKGTMKVIDLDAGVEGYVSTCDLEPAATMTTTARSRVSDSNHRHHHRDHSGSSSPEMQSGAEHRQSKQAKERFLAAPGAHAGHVRDRTLSMTVAQAAGVYAVAAARNPIGRRKLIADAAKTAAALEEEAQRERQKAEELALDKERMASVFSAFRIRMLTAWLATNAILAVLVRQYDPHLEWCALVVACTVVYSTSFKLIGSLVFVSNRWLRSCFRAMCWCCCYRLEVGRASGRQRAVCCCRPRTYYDKDEEWEAEHAVSHAYPVNPDGTLDDGRRGSVLERPADDKDPASGAAADAAAVQVMTMTSTAAQASGAQAQRAPPTVTAAGITQIGLNREIDIVRATYEAQITQLQQRLRGLEGGGGGAARPPAFAAWSPASPIATPTAKSRLAVADGNEGADAGAGFKASHSSDEYTEPPTAREPSSTPASLNGAAYGGALEGGGTPFAGAGALVRLQLTSSRSMHVVVDSGVITSGSSGANSAETASNHRSALKKHTSAGSSLKGMFTGLRSLSKKSVSFVAREHGGAASPWSTSPHEYQAKSISVASARARGAMTATAASIGGSMESGASRFSTDRKAQQQHDDLRNQVYGVGGPVVHRGSISMPDAVGRRGSMMSQLATISPYGVDLDANENEHSMVDGARLRHGAPSGQVLGAFGFTPAASYHPGSLNVTPASAVLDAAVGISASPITTASNRRRDGHRPNSITQAISNIVAGQKTRRASVLDAMRQQSLARSQLARTSSSDDGPAAYGGVRRGSAVAAAAVPAAPVRVGVDMLRRTSMRNEAVSPKQENDQHAGFVSQLSPGFVQLQIEDAGAPGSGSWRGSSAGGGRRLFGAALQARAADGSIGINCTDNKRASTTELRPVDDLEAGSGGAAALAGDTKVWPWYSVGGAPESLSLPPSTSPAAAASQQHDAHPGADRERRRSAAVFAGLHKLQP